MTKEFFELMQVMSDPNSLTTPQQLDNNIIEFCRTINPGAKPIFMKVSPEDWCRQSCCDLNVKKMIELNGGKMVCGYKFWYIKDIYMEAERHAVWSDTDGILRDITFNLDGEFKILFLPDVLDKQNNLNENALRLRKGVGFKFEKAVNYFNELERKRFKFEAMDEKEAWEKMPTYLDWKNGVRKPGIEIKKK